MLNIGLLDVLLYKANFPAGKNEYCILSLGNMFKFRTAMYLETGAKSRIVYFCCNLQNNALCRDGAIMSSATCLASSIGCKYQ